MAPLLALTATATATATGGWEFLLRSGVARLLLDFCLMGWLVVGYTAAAAPAAAAVAPEHLVSPPVAAPASAGTAPVFCVYSAHECGTAVPFG